MANSDLVTFFNGTFLPLQLSNKRIMVAPHLNFLCISNGVVASEAHNQMEMF